MPFIVDGRQICGIATDDGAGADQAALADANSLNDHRARSNMRVVPDLDAAAKHGAWSDVGVRADKAVMIDSRACVDDGVGAYANTGLENGTCHHLRALPHKYIRSYGGVGMLHREKGVTRRAQRLEDSAPPLVADAANAIHQSAAIGGMRRKRRIIAKPGNAWRKTRRNRAIGIDDADNLNARALQRRNHHPAVTTAADDDDGAGHRTMGSSPA
jgi:hypothetical protein